MLMTLVISKNYKSLKIYKKCTVSVRDKNKQVEWSNSEKFYL